MQVCSSQNFVSPAWLAEPTSSSSSPPPLDAEEELSSWGAASSELEGVALSPSELEEVDRSEEVVDVVVGTSAGALVVVEPEFAHPAMARITTNPPTPDSQPRIGGPYISSIC
jgi:hypothetical protein